MMTLDEAWKWYHTTRSQLELFGRLGRKHRKVLPSEITLWNDDKFRFLGGDDISDHSRLCLEHLDDFAVLVLFSVFESIVREKILAEIEVEREDLQQPHLRHIVEQALEASSKNGSYRVLEVFKDRDTGLVEEVNQVRRYRNWVAHGRRDEAPVVMGPEAARARLQRFVDLFF
jgi:hypothetical protein